MFCLTCHTVLQDSKVVNTVQVKKEESIKEEECSWQLKIF